MNATTNATWGGYYAELVTDDNKSPLIKTLAAFFISLVAVSCVGRTATKLYLNGDLKAEDWLAVGATTFATAQYITNIIQSSQGFGKHVNVLSHQEIDSITKGLYAADTFFIVGLALGKMTGAMMTTSISRSKYWKVIQAFQIVCILWTASAVAVVLFQCGMPAPWDITLKTCIDRTAFWIYFCIFNIISDIFLVAIMIINIHSIQTSRSRKTIVMCVFGCRILVIPAVAAQIYYTTTKMKTTDFTFNYWELTTAIQVVQCMNVMTIAIPILKPFMEGASSGLRLADSRRVGQFDSAYAERCGSNTRSRTYAKGSSRAGRLGHEMLDFTAPKHVDMFEMTSLKPGAGIALSYSKGAWDNQSHTSQTILIQQARYFDVQNK